MKATRRDVSVGGIASLMLTANAAAAEPTGGSAPTTEPWYRRVRRWFQINLTEDDPVNFDAGFWRQYWRDARTQGVILNAGGDTAFYPTSIPGHRRAEFLGDRDFFGDLQRMAREDGLALMARMAYRGTPETRAAHPEWLCIGANGERQQRFCMNGGFIYEHCAAILREIGERYRPDGYTLSGWGVNHALCYCPTCTRLFREHAGLALPRRRDWDDPVYQTWNEWNIERMLALWDHHNAIARETGGEHCLWVGQMLGGIRMRGVKALAERSQFLMLDYQGRPADGGFQDGTTTALALSGLVNWEKPMTQAIGIYQSVRMTSSPPTEWGMFMRQAIAGGMRPWVHTVSSSAEDKRRFEGVPPLMQWHERNERYLFDRRPVATVGVVWSEENNFYFGRDQVVERVADAWFGMTHALVRARIPFIVVNADHIERDAAGLRTLVLPNIGALSDEQVSSIRNFVARGGSLFATGDSSLYDQLGRPRADYALGDLFGVHRTADAPTPVLGIAPPTAYTATLSPVAAELAEVFGWGVPRAPRHSEYFAVQSYLRLTPELRSTAYGPHHAREPGVAPGTTRHPVLAGLDQTDLVVYGNEALSRLRLDAGAQALLTYVPPTPGQPPEAAWFRTPRTDLAGLVVNTLPNGARIVFMPAELDRLYSTNGAPDHGTVLANAVRWTAGEIPLEVTGPGLLSCTAYRQPGRMIVQIQNLSGLQGRPPALEFLPVGPVRVRVRLDDGVSGRRARAMGNERRLSVRRNAGWAEVELASIEANELLVFE